MVFLMESYKNGGRGGVGRWRCNIEQCTECGNVLGPLILLYVVCFGGVEAEKSLST